MTDPTDHPLGATGHPIGVKVPDELDPPNPMTPAQLAAGALAVFDKHPDLHDQSYWFLRFEPGSPKVIGHSYEMPDEIDCGTRMCVAGAVCMLAGYRLVVVDYVSHVVHPDRPLDLMEVHELGARLLQLDAVQKDALFYETRNEAALHRLRRVAALGA